MSGDYSRYRFDAQKDFSGVRLQQGRVQLDAEWNEFVAIVDRRFRAQAMDTMDSRCVVPKQTPNAFQITVTGGKVLIGKGRMYIDGLLAENHGIAGPSLDPALHELQGKDPTPYDEQPYYVVPEPSDLPTGGRSIVYLDVWQRDVTAVEDRTLIEEAVDVDTTTRVQTVWQVRVLPGDVGPNASCDDVNDLDAWKDLIRPSAGRLTTKAVGTPEDTDPCFLSETGGYRGLENRLYRIEIHKGGAVDSPDQDGATFKWSRDNAAIATEVLSVHSGLDELTVSRTKRDRYLRFRKGDWIEITDNALEFSGMPGQIRMVKDVKDEEHLIVLESPLTPDANLNFPDVDPSGVAKANRHLRIRRWDQQGLVKDTNGKVLVDLTQSSSSGVIPIPDDGAAIVLEDGVEVTFSTDPETGDAFKVADYWSFAARTATAEVEVLQKAYPLGNHHHFCKLALVDFSLPTGHVPLDCRTLWPPEFAGEDCACDVCVTAESHNSGELTIQSAVQKVKDTGGVVCLGAGVFDLDTQGLSIAGGKSVTLRGKGWQTVLLSRHPDQAILVVDSTNITIESLTVITAGEPQIAGGVLTAENLEALVSKQGAHYATLSVIFSRESGVGGPAVRVRDAFDVSVKNCLMAQSDMRSSLRSVIVTESIVVGTRILNNVLLGGEGVGHDASRQRLVPRALLPTDLLSGNFVATAGLLIEDNVLVCFHRGIGYGSGSYHAAETRFRGNAIYGCDRAGIESTGIVLLNEARAEVDSVPERAVPSLGLSSRIDIQGNIVNTLGNGIIVGTDNTRIQDNDIGSMVFLFDVKPIGTRDGIVLDQGFAEEGIAHCQILSNRILGARGNGIAVRDRIHSAMIKQNIIDGSVGGGIFMEGNGGADLLTVENNQIMNVRPSAGGAVGIRLMDVVDGNVLTNSISAIGIVSTSKVSPTGIQIVQARAITLRGNEIVEIGPERAEDSMQLKGIELLGSYRSAEIGNNRISRSRSINPENDFATWLPLRVDNGAGQRRFDLGDFGGMVLFSGRISGSGISGFAPNALVMHSLSLLPGRLIANPVETGLIGVHGNTMQGHGTTTLAQVASLGSCTFSDNRCRLKRSSTRKPVVDIIAVDIIVSSNFVDTGQDGPVMHLRIPRNGKLTAVGNITKNHKIQLFKGGAEVVFPDPWKMLNEPN